MAVLRSLVTTLGMNSAQYRADLRRAQQTTVSFGAQVKKVADASGKAIGSITSTVLSMKSALIAVGTGAALYGIKQAYENADLIRRQAEMIGVSADKFHQYGYAAKIAGLELDQLGDVFKDLGVHITDAAKTGGGPLVDFFNQINVSAAEWESMSPDEQFRRFADELNKMSDSDARFYLDSINDAAFSLFETLRNGDLLRLTKEAEELGLTLTKAQFQNISDTRKELQALASTGVGVWDQVVAASAPAVSAVSLGIRQWITDQAEAAGGFQQLGIIISETVLQAVVNVAQALEDVMNDAYEGAEKLAAMMGKTLNPQRSSIEQQLDNIVQKMRKIDQQSQSLVGIGDAPALTHNSLGDAPNMLVYTEEQQQKLDELQATYNRLQQELNEPVNFAGGLEDQVDSIISKIKSTNVEIKTSITGNLPASNLPDFSGGVGTVSGGGESTDNIEADLELLRTKYASEQELLLEKTLMEQETLIAAEQAKLISEQESQQLRKQSWDAYYSDVNKAAEDSAKQQAQAQTQANSQLLQMQMALAGNALGIIKNSAEEGSAAWTAATLVQQGLLAAQAIMNAELAAAQTLAAMIIPGVPASVPAAMGMAQQMRMLGYANAALIMAQGIGEIAGARADGGPVHSGKTYLVGERGPELFTAGATGQITSHENLNKAIGGGSGSNNPNWSIIVNEAPPGTTASIDEKAQIIEIAVGKAVATVEENISRGGNSTANTFEQSYGLNRAWGI